MNKTTINFAHANGFPAGSYQKFFRHFPQELRIIAKDKYGHDPAFPVSQNWPNQVKELIAFVEQNADEPVYALGHSFGGVISFIACCERPQLFKGLIMLDPPIFDGWFSTVFRALRSTPLSEKVTPAKQARNRKAVWEEHVDLTNYFKQKKLFKDFDDECIADYVASAITKKEGKHKLDFHAHVEAEIFSNIPHSVKHYAHKLTCPAALVSAENSSSFLRSMAKKFTKRHKINHLLMRNVGHLFPMEKPRQSADFIVDIVRHWQGEESSTVE
jgi:pimeloyl-ACP methyl ester carboxylesterase